MRGCILTGGCRRECAAGREKEEEGKRPGKWKRIEVGCIGKVGRGGRPSSFNDVVPERWPFSLANGNGGGEVTTMTDCARTARLFRSGGRSIDMEIRATMTMMEGTAQVLQTEEHPQRRRRQEDSVDHSSVKQNGSQRQEETSANSWYMMRRKTTTRRMQGAVLAQST